MWPLWSSPKGSLLELITEATIRSAKQCESDLTFPEQIAMRGCRLIILLTACATNAINNNLFPRRRSESTSVCESPACKARADLILASMPIPIPEDSPLVSPFTELTLEVNKDLKEILESLPVVQEARTAREKAAVAYHACMMSGSDEMESLGAVRRVLESNGLRSMAGS
ncbi:hypothetical protein MRX96_029517 [Rhipicephalus microplus]